MNQITGSAAVVLCAFSVSAYVPEPQPVKSAVEITALYYPGTEHMPEWDMVAQACQIMHARVATDWMRFE